MGLILAIVTKVIPWLLPTHKQHKEQQHPNLIIVLSCIFKQARTHTQIHKCSKESVISPKPFMPSYTEPTTVPNLLNYLSFSSSPYSNNECSIVPSLAVCSGSLLPWSVQVMVLRSCRPFWSGRITTANIFISHFSIPDYMYDHLLVFVSRH